MIDLNNPAIGFIFFSILWLNNLFIGFGTFSGNDYGVSTAREDITITIQVILSIAVCVYLFGMIATVLQMTKVIQ